MAVTQSSCGGIVLRYVLYGFMHVVGRIAMHR